MNVEEMIKELQKFPKDMRVAVTIDTGYSYKAVDVSHMTFCKVLKGELHEDGTEIVAGIFKDGE